MSARAAVRREEPRTHETKRQTAMQIAQALAFLTDEAERVGLPFLAGHIAVAEATAQEEARKSAYLLV
ncbi:MAG: hypothetical protein KDE22_14240 [Rhodobacterales bacterium]|nr:hypothetical protein [Rhodobacterales bacterium]